MDSLCTEISEKSQSSNEQDTRESWSTYQVFKLLNAKHAMIATRIEHQITHQGSKELGESH